MVNAFIFGCLTSQKNSPARVGLPFLGRAGRCWLAAVLLAVAGRSQAQTTLANMAVQMNAVVQNSPARIRLEWSADAQATYYDIYRNVKGRDASTALALAVLSSPATATATSFTDSTVAAGVTYEYRIRKTSAGLDGVGFLVAGIEVPAVESRGALVLVVDATHAAYLAADIERLQRDLTGDGWRVVRHDVAPTLPAPQVKALIRADYLAARTLVRAVLLLGHVAVPYSGDIYPDGHPDHLGAWPADAYYADMDGAWTDAAVTSTGAGRPENRNVPGDGKFDQSTLPSDVELQIGRVDLAQLPAFALPERDLLRRYLQKDHDYRHKVFAVTQRGLVADNLGGFGGEDFANNGWRNFAALCGPAQVAAAGYLPTLRTQDYAWAYGCGFGSFTFCNGVAGTTDYAAGPLYSVFNMLYGSYFGDWDSEDNLLRAPLAAEGYALTNCWAGRPDWFFYHMGMGETIGYGARISQNTPGFYTGGAFGQRSVHVALMGDPTLRQHVVAPVAALTAGAGPGSAALAWAASPDAGTGYYVYRATTPAGPFFRLTPQPVTALTYTDPAPLPGNATYLVRALQLTTGASGSYYNLSQGVFVDFTPPPPATVPTAWLGTQSPDWSLPANWRNGAVPTANDTATIAAATPYAPTVGTGVEVAGLVLAPQAQLTVAAGATLTVRATLQLRPAGSSQPPTRLTLAAGTGPAPGGRLVLPDHATAQAGLLLPAGTAFSVGTDAEVRLLGHLAVPGGAFDCEPRGRLTFANDPAAATFGITHFITAPVPVVVGILAIEGSSETLVLNAPVEVLSQVENPATIVTNNQLTLRAGPGRQALLAPVVPAPGQALTLGAYTGTVGVEVYVDGSRNPGLGYRHLAAPVSGSPVSSLASGSFAPVVNPAFNTAGNTVTPFPTVFRYAQARIGAAGVPAPVGFDQGWLSPNGPGDALTTGTGYAVNMPGNALLSFRGPVLTAASFLWTGLRRGADAEAGWQLLGNPFAAPLDWDQLTSTSTYSSLDKALYVFKSSGPYAGTYASYVPAHDSVASTGVNGGTNVVPVGQGFFVRTKPGPSVGAMRVGLSALLTAPDPTAVQRGAPDQRPRLTLALRDAAGTRAHETAIYFQAGATAGPDADYDAPYFAGPGQALTLTSATGGPAFGINGLPPLTGADVAVALQLSAATAGPYELAATTLAHLPAGYHAYLHDAAAGTYTDLAATPVVAVPLAANAPVPARYRILFTTQLRVLATAPAALAALVSLSPNPAHGLATLVVPPALREKRTTVVVLNIVGQTVAAQRFGPAAPEGLAVPLAGLAPGLYTVRVSTTVGLVSRRLVVE